MGFNSLYRKIKRKKPRKKRKKPRKRKRKRKEGGNRNCSSRRKIYGILRENKE